MIIGICHNETGSWSLTVLNVTHNHSPTFSGPHLIHRNLAWTNEVKDLIISQTRVGASSKQVISAFLEYIYLTGFNTYLPLLALKLALICLHMARNPLSGPRLAYQRIKSILIGRRYSAAQTRALSRMGVLVD